MLSGFRPLPCYRISHPERRVVRHPGSLTRLLRGFSRARFHVDVLGESIARPQVSEALALGINPKQLAWIREVHLCGDDRPWVRARTVIPVQSLRGPAKALKQLGNRPLGTALFGARPGSARISSAAPSQPPTATGQCWRGGRVSVAGPVRSWLRNAFYRNCGRIPERFPCGRTPFIVTASGLYNRRTATHQHHEG